MRNNRRVMVYFKPGDQMIMKIFLKGKNANSDNKTLRK